MRGALVMEYKSKNVPYFWCFNSSGEEIALIVRDSHSVEGVDFLTPNSFSQQLALMSRPTGHRIDSHTHLPVSRDVRGTHEVIIMKSGKLRLDLYETTHEYIESVLLEKGDVALLCGGGHGFESIENAVFFEIKQGPYTPEQDKVRFEPTHNQEYIWNNQ